MFWNKRKIEGVELYFTPTCSYCDKVKRKLWWWGLEVDLREVMFNPENQQKLIEEGGKNQVPCLHVTGADGESRWMYESDDILAYLKAESDKR